MGLRQKQSNQPVLGLYLSNFIIQHPVAWNPGYASVSMKHSSIIQQAITLFKIYAIENKMCNSEDDQYCMYTAEFLM